MHNQTDDTEPSSVTQSKNRRQMFQCIVGILLLCSFVAGAWSLRRSFPSLKSSETDNRGPSPKSPQRLARMAIPDMDREAIPKLLPYLEDRYSPLLQEEARECLQAFPQQDVLAAVLPLLQKQLTPDLACLTQQENLLWVLRPLDGQPTSIRGQFAELAASQFLSLAANHHQSEWQSSRSVAERSDAIRQLLIAILAEHVGKGDISSESLLLCLKNATLKERRAMLGGFRKPQAFARSQALTGSQLTPWLIEQLQSLSLPAATTNAPTLANTRQIFSMDLHEVLTTADRRQVLDVEDCRQLLLPIENMISVLQRTKDQIENSEPPGFIPRPRRDATQSATGGLFGPPRNHSKNRRQPARLVQEENPQFSQWSEERSACIFAVDAWTVLHQQMIAKVQTSR